MRIIITDKGLVLKKNLNEENEEQSRKKKEEFKKEFMERIKSPISRNKPANEALYPSTNLFSFNQSRRNHMRFRSYDLGSKEPINEINDVKEININDKVLIPKNDLERYNQSDSDKLVSTIFPRDLMKKQERLSKDIEDNIEKIPLNDFTTLHGLYNKQALPVKEILGKQSLEKVYISMEKREFMKNKLSHVNDIKFRTPYQKSTKKMDMEENLGKLIDVSNVDLIKYLNSKSDLPEQLLVNLKRFDEEKLAKTNKICQKVLEANEKYKSFKEHTREKLHPVNGVLAEARSVNAMMESCMRRQMSFREIASGYKRKDPGFGSYIFQVHKEVKRNFWEKFNAEHLERRSHNNRAKTKESKDKLTTTNL